MGDFAKIVDLNKFKVNVYYIEQRFKELSRISLLEDLPAGKIYKLYRDYMENLDEVTYNRYLKMVKKRTQKGYELYITERRNNEDTVMTIDAINMYLAVRENKEFRINEDGQLEIDVFAKLGKNKYDYILKDIFTEDEEVLEGLDEYY